MIAAASPTGERQPADGEVQASGTMPALVNRPRSRCATSTADRSGDGERRERDEQSLAGDHPPHLSRRASDRAEERELAVALLDRERERAGDDEDRDEGGEHGEDGQPGDDVLAAQGILRRFRFAALRAGQHAKRPAGRARRGRAARPSRRPRRARDDAEQVDAVAGAGETGGDVVAEEDAAWRVRSCTPRGGRDAGDGEASRVSRGQDPEAVTEPEPSRGPRGARRATMSVDRRGAWPLVERVRRERGARPAVTDRGGAAAGSSRWPRRSRSCA